VRIVKDREYSLGYRLRCREPLRDKRGSYCRALGDRTEKICRHSAGERVPPDNRGTRTPPMIKLSRLSDAPASNGSRGSLEFCRPADGKSRAEAGEDGLQLCRLIRQHRLDEGEGFGPSHAIPIAVRLRHRSRLFRISSCIASPSSLRGVRAFLSQLLQGVRHNFQISTVRR